MRGTGSEPWGIEKREGHEDTLNADLEFLDRAERQRALREESGRQHAHRGLDCTVSARLKTLGTRKIHPLAGRPSGKQQLLPAADELARDPRTPQLLLRRGGAGHELHTTGER